MSLLKGTLLACVLALGIPVAGVMVANANPTGARQYYSGWSHYKSYYYRSYYYKPYPTYYGYKHHYLTYYPSRPNYYYYYNPYTKHFWGRCPVDCGGREQYSLLPESERRGDIGQIPEKAFPAPGQMPAIPEATDGTKIDLPPDEKPQDAEAALPAK
jgi:hypothetical protein